jgi:hypothetical protein
LSPSNPWLVATYFALSLCPLYWTSLAPVVVPKFPVKVEGTGSSPSLVPDVAGMGVLVIALLAVNVNLL